MTLAHPLSTADPTEAFAARAAPAAALVDDAEAVAQACHAMARRFAAGGRLLVFGTGSSATDAQHVSVEFVHPVIVGKRALPALALTNDIASLTGLARRHGLAEMFAWQLRRLAQPDDIALGLATDPDDPAVLAGLAEASALGLLTVALIGAGTGEAPDRPAVDHLLVVRSANPRVVKEIQVTIYHVLWELVHVFFEQPGLLSAGAR